MKQDLIGKWYNPDLTDEQNISLLKEHGISISKRTLITWRKNNSIIRTRGGDHCSKEYKKANCKSKVQNSLKQSAISDQSEKSKLQKQSESLVPKCKKQDAKLNESKVQNSLKQSAISEEESEVLDWDMEDGKFMEIMPKGKITSEMYDKMFGDDSVPHYTGKTPPKQITLETFRNETGDLPVKDVKYYLSKNLPEVIDDAEEFKKWINATFYLLKGTKNWTDYLLHRETYSKILAAANRGYSADYEKGTTVEQWQIQRAKDSYYKMWGNYKYPYFEKKYSNEPYNVACEDLYKTYGIVPMRLEDYRRMMDEKSGKKQEKINSDPNWQPFSMKGNTYADEDYDEDEEEEIERKNYDKDISNKAVNGMTNEEMMRFVCDGNF